VSPPGCVSPLLHGRAKPSTGAACFRLSYFSILLTEGSRRDWLNQSISRFVIVSSETVQSSLDGSSTHCFVSVADGLRLLIGVCNLVHGSQTRRLDLETSALQEIILGAQAFSSPFTMLTEVSFRCPTQSWEDLPIGALFQALVRLVLATQRCFPSLEGGTLWNAGIAPLSRALRSRDPYVYGFCIPHAEKNPYDLSWNRASQADSLSGSPQLPN
jgi:hypothetical protein